MPGIETLILSVVIDTIRAHAKKQRGEEMTARERMLADADVDRELEALAIVTGNLDELRRGRDPNGGGG